MWNNVNTVSSAGIRTYGPASALKDLLQRWKITLFLLCQKTSNSWYENYMQMVHWLSWFDYGKKVEFTSKIRLNSDPLPIAKKMSST